MPGYNLWKWFRAGCRETETQIPSSALVKLIGANSVRSCKALQGSPAIPAPLKPPQGNTKQEQIAGRESNDGGDGMGSTSVGKSTVRERSLRIPIGVGKR